ncbi:lens fiber membrane intrinsic protein-like [Rhinophrynus dorsalis]
MLGTNVAGIIASSISFVLVLTGLLTDYWIVNFSTDLYHEGLWQHCVKNVCVKVLQSESIDATRGLLVLSTALLILGLVSSCLSFTNISIGKVTASLLAGVLEFTSAVFLLIGMSVYTGEKTDLVNNTSVNYQWSFYLCWVALPSLIFAAVSHILAHKITPRAGYEAV